VIDENTLGDPSIAGENYREFSKISAGKNEFV
jgi:hypothetical protein